MTEKVFVYKHPFFDKKTVLVATTSLLLGCGLILTALAIRMPYIKQEAFDSGFRSGQWNGFYYSGNLEDAAAAQVRMQELGEWNEGVENHE